ncbi:MAG: hypothetical protein WCC12_14555, partial [Anaerolineales bacterium]
VLRDFFSMGSVFSVAKKVFTHTFRHSHDQQDITLHAEGSTIQVLRVGPFLVVPWRFVVSVNKFPNKKITASPSSYTQTSPKDISILLTVCNVNVPMDGYNYRESLSRKCPSTSTRFFRYFPR